MKIENVYIDKDSFDVENYHFESHLNFKYEKDGKSYEFHSEGGDDVFWAGLITLLTGCYNIETIENVLFITEVNGGRNAVFTIDRYKITLDGKVIAEEEMKHKGED